MTPDLPGPHPATPTPSLRRRVALMVLGLLALLLLVLGFTIDVLMGVQVRHDLHERLMATAARADALAAAGTPPNQLVAQLGGGGVRALLVTPDNATYGDRAIDPETVAGSTVPLPPPPPPLGGPPPPPPPGGPPPPPDPTATAIVHPLRGGGRIILVADTTPTTALIRGLRETMIGGGAITLAVAALLLIVVTGAALRPLDRLTALARAITTGDRGQRLHPDQADTELGRAATAFDGMLDALESSEHHAQQSAQAAHRAEAATRQFLGDAAHELRTPIAGIRAAAEQLLRAAIQNGDDDQHRRAALVLSESRRAGKLVADMLDLSHIDSDLALDRVHVNLTAIADAECERAKLLSPDLDVTRTGDPEVFVYADPARVTQILANLADNARRYSAPGQRITIDVRRASDAEKQYAELTITDSGPGIPKADRERIFQRLVRLDTGRDRDRGGAGLGLSIARALADAHHGTLTCLPHSPGAKFQLTLPLYPMHDAPGGDVH